MSAKAILVVEDEEKDSRLLRLAFKKANVFRPIVVARDGQEAMAYLRRFGKYRERSRYPEPCMILIDLTLPGMNGLQLLGWLKGQPEFERVPRVVLTASGLERDRKLAKDLGCRDYYVKPPGLEELVQIVRVLAGCGSRKTACFTLRRDAANAMGSRSAVGVSA